MIDSPDLEGVVITPEDCRLAGHCPGGIRTWMDAHIEGGARRLWTGGVPAAEMWATGDGDGIQVVEHKLNRLAQESTNG